MNLKMCLKEETVLSLSQQAKKIAVGGFYRHYKGLKYKVLYIARHSETLEELIVYQAQYGDWGVWVRPLSMFLENVIIEGVEQPRFLLLE